MKKILRKLRHQGGMTLLELMVCVGLLSLVGAMLSGITSVGSRVYAGSNFVSEAQTFSATVDVALGNLLNYATDVKTGDGNAVTSLTIEKIGMYDGKFTLEDGKYLCYNTTTPANTVYPVQKAAYGTIVITQFTLTYDGDCFTAKVTLASNVGVDTSNSEFTVYTYTYRPISG